MIVEPQTFRRMNRWEVWMTVEDWAELAEVSPPVMCALLNSLVRKGEWERMGGEYRPCPKSLSRSTLKDSIATATTDSWN